MSKLTASGNRKPKVGIVGGGIGGVALARSLAMSRIQLYRKLKALTGETPNSLLRNIRLKRAAQLLATHQFNVSEVAYKVGFTDLKYFRERFREQFGVNPGEYEGN